MSTKRQSADGGVASKGGGGFMFGKARSSVRILRKNNNQPNNGSESTPPPAASSNPLGRWLRGLGSSNHSSGANNSTTSSNGTDEGLNRANPVYHSEGKGLRKRSKNKDRRRYSFNEKVEKSSSNAIANGRKEVVKGECSAAKEQAAGPKLPMSRSTPNLQQPVSIFYVNDAPASAGVPGTGGLHHHLPPPPSRSDSVGSLLASSSSGLSSWGSIQDASKAGWEQAPTPPVRDASSLKALRYGPGHEKFPSWPVPAAADQLPAVKQCCHNTGGSHRSKSWTEQTDYPKESNGPYYSRPYLRRQASSGITLKTVLERSEAALMFAEPPPPEQPHLRSLPTLDREGQAIGDLRYLAPSPPERDASVQKTDSQVPLLTQAEVEEYARTYDAALLRQQSAELFGCCTGPVHQSQGSYAQSEGYHSYVSSTDSTNTPFLDRLRQDSQGGHGHHHHHQASVASSGLAWDEDEAASMMGPSVSAGDLRWRGSLSDMSVTSSSVGLSSLNTRQLIAHSSKVQTPQRHMSESVLILSSQHNQPPSQANASASWLRANRSYNQSVGNIRNSALHNFTVAERINELERQSFSSSTTALAPPKVQPRLKPSAQGSFDSSNLKAVQKQALLSFYERQHQQKSSAWKSEPYLAPPPAPPRSAAVEAYNRRAEQIDFEWHLSDPEPSYLAKPVSLSPHSEGSLRRQSHSSSSSISSGDALHLSPHHMKPKKLPSPTDTSADLLGPLILGSPILLDEWVPERPPKKPHLRANIPSGRSSSSSSALQPPHLLKRCTSSPEPPPPPTPPPPNLDNDVFHSDEPLPPPPVDIENVCTEGSNSKSSSIPSTVVSSSAGLLRSNVDAPCSIEGSYKRTPETPVKASVVTTPLDATTRASIASSVAVGVAPSLASSAPRIFRPLTNKQPLHNNNNHSPNVNHNNNNNSVKSGLDGVARQLSALSIPGKKGLFEKNKHDDHRLILPPKKPTLYRPALISDPCPVIAPLANRSLKPMVPPLPSVPPPLTDSFESQANSLDASSQTDLSSRTEAPCEPSSNEKPLASGAVSSRLASEAALREEEECAQLTRDLASQLSPSDRLQEILAPQVEKIKPTEFVEGLFQMRPPSRASTKTLAKAPSPTPAAPPQVNGHNKSAELSATEPLPANSAYFTTSEPKAMFLTRYSKDISSSNPPIPDLQHKKEELVARLTKKLEILKEEQTVVAMEIKINEMLGLGLQDRLKEAAKHQEAAKLALHVDEVGKITSLLLGLSGRLARVENALVGLTTVPKSEEKDTLLAKRDKLTSQLTEAKYLKECIDKRSAHLAKMLTRILDLDASTDFEHFICMKASLQVCARELDDRIGLGEEQLAALRETLSA
ncbi:protein Shroom-like isoform X2 [Neocloeon triangulifer]|uniref:protein Shroom-like isoform X2 n=1 Tax=Neocloeon triangulifer TaxID=2078957 RepID=UPI00286F5FA3|nr:protein Shroom-like isoform X2 [Neocloeon triangulifer]